MECFHNIGKHSYKFIKGPQKNKSHPDLKFRTDLLAPVQAVYTVKKWKIQSWDYLALLTKHGQNTKKRKVLTDMATKSYLDAVHTICINLLHGNIPMSLALQKKLKLKWHEKSPEIACTEKRSNQRKKRNSFTNKESFFIFWHHSLKVQSRASSGNNKKWHPSRKVFWFHSLCFNAVLLVIMELQNDPKSWNNTAQSLNSELNHMNSTDSSVWHNTSSCVELRKWVST